MKRELKDYELSEVTSLYKHFKSKRGSKERMWKLIRKFYNGDFWSDVKDKLPKHQILPDTNYLKYVADNIVNSVYSANYVANVLPRHYADNMKALQLNAFLDYKWNCFGMKQKYPTLGRNAILYNYGVVQIGWNSSMIGGSVHKRELGGVELKLLPPEQVFFDPAVTNYEDGRALFISRRVSIFDLLNEPDLKEGAKEYIKQLKDKNGNFMPESSDDIDTGNLHGEMSNDIYSKTVTLLEGYYKKEDEKGNWRLDHIFIADNKFLLGVQTLDLKFFPIEVLYENKPDSGPYGNPKVKTILSNVATINMLDSIEATHAYASQNRTKLVNVKSGINYRSFSKHGNTPNIAFPVNGEPDKVIRYVDLQSLPILTELRGRLEQSIFLDTGVDLRYTGRDTGSIQTTGGTDLSQQRIMAMTDNERIITLETFVENLTRKVISYYVQFGDTYYPAQIQQGLNKIQEPIGVEENVIDFKNMPDNKFDYVMNAAPFLPKNSIRLSDAADYLLQMQGQFQYNPPIITHEEWLMWKDFPQKELILQRIMGEKQQLDKEELTADLLSFAGMIDKGVDPNDAIDLLAQEKQFKRDNPGMGVSQPQAKEPQMF